MSVDDTGATAISVTGAIRQAAQKTGANFNYLLATARVESNLNPNAQATSSSAGGLFQFIELLACFGEPSLRGQTLIIGEIFASLSDERFEI